MLVGLRDVTVLGVAERLRQPLEVCVDPQHPGSIALSRSQKLQVPLYDVLPHELGHHIGQGRGKGETEQFAHWFAQFQESRLRRAETDDP
jgi:hypothetical protein